MKKKGNVTYSIAFKVFLYILLVVSAMGCVGFLFTGIYLAEAGAYTRTYTDYLYEALRPVVHEHFRYICFDKTNFATLEDMEEAFERESEKNGISYAIWKDSVLLWSNCEDKDTPYSYVYVMDGRFEQGKTENLPTYVFELYVDKNFPKQDDFSNRMYLMRELYAARFLILGGMAAGALLVIISLVWLMCNAGHRRGQEEIVPGPLTSIPLDLLAALFGGVAIMGFWIFASNWPGSIFEYALAVLAGGFEVVWVTIFCRELALRMKLGKWWQNTLIYKFLRLAWRAFKAFFEGAPSILHVIAIIIFLSGCEFMWLSFRREDRYIWWLAEKLIVLPLVFYCALAFEKLKKGSGNLAEGNLSCKLDTKFLVLDFKEHGENLNKIGEGISKAVEQRMQSERLKTELITNVSHDLKTPLTSIINYADLLGSEAGREDSLLDKGKIAEYAEVLFRQSNRLKKLLDDLMEASKATTGSLEVNLAPCELGVLLTQAAGEYEARFAEKNLKLHINQPEEEIRVMADGRHLWRVFDNLLNNVCKYAQEGSRVYLNVESEGKRARVVFRNMSKYELNISAKELEERFVRGDKSRHMEGNGLGLSIAKSLTELQNGEMRIVTDGDLFKVILEFAVLEE